MAGISIFLYQQKQSGRAAASRFLFTRGLWLIVLEMLVINFVLQWSYNLIVFEVIWVLGWAMLVLAGLIWLPRWLVAGLALAVVLGHDALPAVVPAAAAN